MTTTTLPNGRKITKAVISQGKKILEFELPNNGGELCEEYDVITDELLLRKFRTKSAIGNYSSWETEVGLGNNVAAFNADRDLMKESSSTPVVTRKDTADSIQFRIRNLNLPEDVFAVSVEGSVDPFSIVVRTSNKKYFKKLAVPEMKRANLPLEGNSVSFTYERGTLIISYKKPLFLLAMEAEDKKLRSSMKFQRLDDPKSAGAAAAGGAGCDQQ